MSGDIDSAPEAKDGLTADPARDPAARLLMDAPLDPGGTLLLIEGGCGPLAARFAPRFHRTICQNSLYRNHIVSQALVAPDAPRIHCLLGDLPRALPSSERKSNGSASDPSSSDASLAMPPESCDEILFRLGRGTALINAALIEAFRLLKPGGSLWVAGRNQEGIKSFAKRAEAHFGNAQLLQIKASCRLLRFRKESDAPKEAVEDPGYFDPVRLEIDVARAGRLPYWSKPGIFSYRATDLGTALLARHLPDCSGCEVLDLCCGSGVLALAAFKLGARSALAVDANAIATACAALNLAQAGVSGRVSCTNLTEGVTADFDIILSNPPFHNGSETDFSFPGKILDALASRLRPGGVAYLVANRFLDYIAQCARRSLSVEVLAREQGYCVYRMIKSAQA